MPTIKRKIFYRLEIILQSEALWGERATSSYSLLTKRHRNPQVSEVRAWARPYSQLLQAFCLEKCTRSPNFIYDTTKRAKGLEDTPCSLWPGLHSELYTGLLLNQKVRPVYPNGGGLVAKSCVRLFRPHRPGSSVHGILQARILEWVAISFSRVSSQPRNQTPVSCLAGRLFTNWVTRKACLP